MQGCVYVAGAFTEYYVGGGKVILMLVEAIGEFLHHFFAISCVFKSYGNEHDSIKSQKIFLFYYNKRPADFLTWKKLTFYITILKHGLGP